MHSIGFLCIESKKHRLDSMAREESRLSGLRAPVRSNEDFLGFEVFLTQSPYCRIKSKVRREIAGDDTGLGAMRDGSYQLASGNIPHAQGAIATGSRDSLAIR